MKYIFSILIYIMLPIGTFAANGFTEAQKAYDQKDYVQAASLYEGELTKEKVSKLSFSERSEGYYNLGNCYYRMKDYAHAVLNYERALKQNPANEDARFNLQLTQVKLKDKFDAPSEMFFISWFKEVVKSQNFATWGLWGLYLLLAAFALFACFALSERVILRKAGFFGGLLAVVCILFCEGFAFAQYRNFYKTETAVVMQATDTYDTPTTTGHKLKPLNEGTTIIVRERYNKNWMAVELPDGSEVWIKAGNTELI